MSTDDTTASEHGADAETTAVPPLAAEEPDLAWSADDEPDEAQPNRHGRLVWAGLTVLVVAVTAALVLLLSTLFTHRQSNTAKPQPIPPAAVLDGTYRLDYDFSKETANGAPNPQPNTNNTGWWAFRSSCTSAGCVATATKLAGDNHQSAFTPALTAALHFVDGHWQSAPTRRQLPQPQCLGADGRITAGDDTEMLMLSLAPQPDTTLSGVQTQTALTSECGHQGRVAQMPFVATRIGVVPTGVTVADPATITASPSTPAVAGPTLDGTYRLDYKFADQAINGQPNTAFTTSDNKTYWWAFRSLCTSTGCVATMSKLDDDNHAATTGFAGALHFADGIWQSTTYLGPSLQCAATGTGAEQTTTSWSLKPQPDGTLQGLETVTILTGECGDQGSVVKTPFVATRTGDVATSVTVADPALFEPPAAPPTNSPHP